jgi:predicted regulator of Ras-like GTPase activity (Roadblock/LC7/MglB family)
MSVAHQGTPPVEDLVREQLQLIRRQVAGVRGSIAATSDGLVFAHDIPDLEASQIAAISAATLALASRATMATGCGSFREAVARGSDGYLAVYAAGESTIVAVIGTSSLNVGMLQFRARGIIDRIAAYSAQIGAWAAPVRAAEMQTAPRPVVSAPAPQPHGTQARAPQAPEAGGPPLPRRRPAAS